MTPRQVNFAVVVHAYHVDVLPFVLERLRHAGTPTDVFVTVCPERRAEVEALCRAQIPEVEILSVENTGYDLGPFLTILPKLLEGRFDVALKIHTKKGAAGLEETRSDTGNIWSDLLLDAVLRSPSAVQTILGAFASDPLLGVAGPAELYKSAKFLAHGNEHYATRILRELDPKLDPAPDWGFFAGSMFWFRPEIFRPLLALTSAALTNSSITAATGQFASPWHALEQVLGRLPQMQGFKTGLIYSGPERDHTHLQFADESRIPHGNRYPVGVTLAGALDLAESHAMLRENPNFDSSFYEAHYQDFASSGGDAPWHYLRYGVYEGCNPNSDFDSAWYWDEHNDVLKQRQNPLVHYLNEGKRQGSTVFPARENTLGAMKQVAASGLFEPEFYCWHNPWDGSPPDNTLEHYCTRGWQEFRLTTSRKHFDPIWYESEYLRHYRSAINPLLHYAACRESRPLRTRPDRAPVKRRKPARLTTDKPIRRVCLFAGYDPHGQVDEYVVRYVRELSRHAEVFYLADCEIAFNELTKLSDCTSGAWAVRHGEYDFGSYKRLARHYVGWDRLQDYDEVLLVNDSAYLLRPLDHVFEKMSKTACDWWALQATKGVYATRFASGNDFFDKIPFSQVVCSLSKFEQDNSYDFHMASYFLAFRHSTTKPRGELQRLLDSVKPEDIKKAIVHKYEVNLTRRLILAGYTPATFCDDLYPIHPVYTEQHFELLEKGFPVLKRLLLTDNHYQVPGLWRWEQRVKQAVPGADLEPIKANLRRITDEQDLYESQHIPPSESFFRQARARRRSALHADKRHRFWSR